MSPDGTIKNERDYILTDLHRNVLDIQVINLHYSSDHRFLRAAIKLKEMKYSRSRYTKKSSTLKMKDELDILNQWYITKKN